MIRTSILFITGFLLSLVAVGQNKIVGKWKPVSFSMDKIITGDIKADSIHLSDTLDVVLKNDKDPAASKELMKIMAGIMLDKMKKTEEEFLSSGEYIETNTQRNTTKKGSYTFEAATNLLTTTIGNKANKFIVSFKNGKLILTGELESRNGNKGSLIVEYEKL